MVCSSDGLERVVEGALRGELLEVRALNSVVLDGRSSAAQQLVPLLERVLERGRVVSVRGIAKLKVEGDGRGSRADLLGFLNLNRERFDREGEGFVFFLDPVSAVELSRLAPDMERYGRRFEFLDWWDLLEAEGDEAVRAAGQTRTLLDEWTDQERRLQRARDAKAPPALLAGLLFVMMTLARRLLRGEEEWALTEEFVVLASLSGDARLRLLAAAQQAQVLAARGEFEAARQRAAAALANPTGMPEPGLLARGHSAMAWAQGSADCRRTLRSWERAATQYELGGELDNAGLTLGNAVGFLIELGQLHEAARALAAARALSQRARNSLLHAALEERSADLAIHGGELREALLSIGRATALGRLLGSAEALEHCRTTLGAWLRATGAPTSALSVLQERLDLSRQGGKVAEATSAAADLAELLSDLGRWGTLQALAAELSPLALSLPSSAGLHRALCRHALADSDLPSASAVLALARQVAEPAGYLLQVARADQLEAIVSLAHSNPAAALTALSRSTPFHEQAGFRPALARDHVLAAFAHLHQGDAERGRQLAAEGLLLIETCGSLRDQPMALAALGLAARKLDQPGTAAGYEQRWRRLIAGMEARGLERIIEILIEGGTANGMP